MIRTRPLPLLAVSLALVACGDPVHSNAIDKLGGEKPGVHPGPLHRPGQPCTVCHDGSGPGNMIFSLAGTVFEVPNAPTPLVDAIVRFVDFRGKTYVTGTNCAGNFFVTPEDYSPTFPVWVKVEFAGGVQHMGSPFFREASCAACHFEPAGPDSPGRIYFAPPTFTFPPSG